MQSLPVRPAPQGMLELDHFKFAAYPGPGCYLDNVTGGLRIAVNGCVFGVPGGKALLEDFGELVVGHAQPATGVSERTLLAALAIALTPSLATQLVDPK